MRFQKSLSHVYSDCGDNAVDVSCLYSLLLSPVSLQYTKLLKGVEESTRLYGNSSCVEYVPDAFRVLVTGSLISALHTLLMMEKSLCIKLLERIRSLLRLLSFFFWTLSLLCELSLYVTSVVFLNALPILRGAFINPATIMKEGLLINAIHVPIAKQCFQKLDTNSSA